jgi:hypothetical protein
MKHHTRNEEHYNGISYGWLLLENINNKQSTLHNCITKIKTQVTLNLLLQRKAKVCLDACSAI